MAASRTLKWKAKGRLVTKGTNPDSGISVCTHPTVVRDLCAECGADLRSRERDAGGSSDPASISMVHCVPELVISKEEAVKLANADKARLIRNKQLVLLVDLDQTLIHTTNDLIPPNLKDVYHFQQPAHNSVLWYHTKFRPHTQDFLERISKLFELHICTFGSRVYAHTIARFLDPYGKFFSHRILSREEFMNERIKSENLQSLFPCGDSMVCIIDDREDVWNFMANVVHVKPYLFFQGTADINAPSALQKIQYDSTIKHQVRMISHSKVHTTDDVMTKEQADASPTDDVMTKKQADASPTDDVITKEQTDASLTDDVMTKEQADSSPTDDVMTKEQADASSIDDVMTKEQADASPTDDVMTTEQTDVSPSNDVNIEVSSENYNDKNIKLHDCILETKLSKDSDDTNTPIKKENLNIETDDKTVTSKENETIKGENEDKSCISSIKKSSDETSTEKTDGECDEIEWVDEDDYLLYLEDILRKIHLTFFKFLDSDGSREPDLKNIIPYIRSKVLRGVNVLFSGIVPTNMALNTSRPFLLCKALGANVQTEFIPKSDAKTESEATTHVIAARLGTSKVRLAKRHKEVFVVTLEWLFACNERWDRVDERLYILTADRQQMTDFDTSFSKRTSDSDKSHDYEISDKNKCSKGNKDNEVSNKTKETISVYDRTTGKRVASQVKNKIEAEKSNLLQTGSIDLCSNKSSVNPLTKEKCHNEQTLSKDNEMSHEEINLKPKNFAESINFLMNFTENDLTDMYKEIDEILDSDSSDNETADAPAAKRLKQEVIEGADSSSDDSLSGGRFPRGWGVSKFIKSRSVSSESLNEDNQQRHSDVSDEDDQPMEIEDSDSELKKDVVDDLSDVEDQESIDEVIVAAVEREFC